MIKAIFFDIDGTLVGSNSKAHESTKSAIKMAQSKGIFCGVATGRGPVRIEGLIDHLNLDMFVTYNGQLVYNKEQVLFAQSFAPAVLKEIVDFADDHHRQIVFGGKDRIDGSATIKIGNSAFAKRLARILPKKFPVRMMKRALQNWSPNRRKTRYHDLSILNEPIYQCVLLSPESEHHKLAAQLPNCSFQRSNPYSVDIVPKGGSKIQGIKAFAKENQMELSEIMAFGDHYNDTEMLTSVGIGIAMGNAQEDVKKLADFVTFSNEKDGIAHAMRHFKIIE